MEEQIRQYRYENDLASFLPSVENLIAETLP